MNKFAVILFLNSLSLAACQANRPVAPAIMVYDDTLVPLLQDYTGAINQKRATLEFATGEKAGDCASYIQMSKTTSLKEDVNNQLVKSEYLVCDVLALIGKRGFNAGGKGAEFGKVLATRLDLRSYPSSLAQMVDDNKNTLAQLDAKLLITKPAAVIYETTEWHYQLKLVAVSDLNNNAKPDWLIWLADETKNGNYRNYQTLVAYDVADHGLIVAVPYPDIK
jgi:hypothetical protein